MDRDTILKHSRAIRLEHKLLPDFVELLEEICVTRGHPEYLQPMIRMLEIPELGNRVINAVLEYFEREYHIVKIEKLPDIRSNNINKLINII